MNTRALETITMIYDHVDNVDKAFLLVFHERIVDCRPVGSIDDLSSLKCHKGFLVHAIDWDIWFAIILG